MFINLGFLLFVISAPNTPGTDGKVASNYLQKLKLTGEAQNKYPFVLLKLMKRHAEDLIWANEIKLGGKILKFLCRITENREDASALRKGEFLF